MFFNPYNVSSIAVFLPSEIKQIRRRQKKTELCFLTNKQTKQMDLSIIAISISISISIFGPNRRLSRIEKKRVISKWNLGDFNSF